MSTRLARGDGILTINMGLTRVIMTFSFFYSTACNITVATIITNVTASLYVDDYSTRLTDERLTDCIDAAACRCSAVSTHRTVIG